MYVKKKDKNNLKADRTFEYAPSPMRVPSSYPLGLRISSSAIRENFYGNLISKNFGTFIDGVHLFYAVAKLNCFFFFFQSKFSGF